MKTKIYFLCFFTLFLTACTQTVNKENEKEITCSTDKLIKITTTTAAASEKNPTTFESAETEEETSSEITRTKDSSKYSFNPKNPDTDMKLSFTKNSKTSSLKFTLGMSYDDVEKSLTSIGEDINKTPWDAYSNYTIIDKKELWPKLKTQDDYYKYASIEVYLRNDDLKYAFFFISNSNTNILNCIQCDNSSTETNTHIKCGDHITDLLKQYGINYNQYNTGKFILYEYKRDNSYLDFYIDPQSNLISEWGINLYSYQDYTECGTVLDRIYSGEVSNPESPPDLTQSIQNAGDYKEGSVGEVSSSAEHNSSVITQEEALNIVKNKLESHFRSDDYLIFDNCQTKEGNDYYVFRYYNNSGTIAWFYVNQTDGSCYVLDCMAKENDLIEYHSGDIY